MTDVHNIAILGGQFAGIRIAHELLKALPGLKSQTNKSYKITLISNSTHFWFSVGAPRAMLIPFPTDINDSFIPISKGFEKYSKDTFEFIHAQITGLDPEQRNVLYMLKDDKEDLAEVVSTFHFDTVLICTGSTGPSPHYALQGSHVPSLNAYKDTQSRLPAAKSVMVVGGGPAGVETAGELGHLHGSSTSSPKDITILSGQSRLLPSLQNASVGAHAEKLLKGMGVNVEHNVRLVSSKALDNGTGTTEVFLSDNSTRTVDILLEATGRHPTASFLPPSFLDTKGRVIVDNYMRLPASTLSSAYSVGDVCSISNGTLVFLEFSLPVAVKNIVADLSGKSGAAKEYKPFTTKDMQMVPVGPNGGVGTAFGWSLPGFAVKMVKSKTYMFPKAMETVMGG